jgi:predicted DNA repair protein MutK
LHGRGYSVPLVTPLMMLGGAFLCFEGVEKLAHKFLHKGEDEQEHAKRLAAVQDAKVDMVAFEKDKIRGAIRTDFILSAEIIVISLGTLGGRTFIEQVMTLVAIAAIMTVGVYGLVGGIVKLDDAGLALTADARENGWARFKRAFGRGILYSAPYLMKFLSIAGTAAMFLVGGGILVHSIPALHHLIQPHAEGNLGWLWGNLFNAGVGIVAGAVIVAVVTAFSRLRGKRHAG